VSDVLPALLDRHKTDVVYACGPMAMLHAVALQCATLGVACQVAVEESMACGIGVCMTCVLPVVGDDGRTRMVRSCVEGPVFAADRVRWDDVGSVPADAVGAPGAPP
jgi:dihydroorotate dehydrogenase electron transfer subunit